MRRLPTLIAIGFIVITLWRVGQFADTRMRGSWSGWVFSIFLGMAVYASAYFTRDSITAKEDGKEDKRSKNVKSWAWKLLIFAVLADGLFNLAEVWASVKPPYFDVDPLLWIGTAVFGAFPTLVAAGMGALQGHVDRLPKPPANEKTAIFTAFKRLAVKYLDRLGQEPVKEPARIAIAEHQEAQEKPLLPPLAGRRLEIYSLATRNPAPSQSEIAQELNLSRQRVGQYLKEMQDQGYLHVNGKVKAVKG